MEDLNKKAFGAVLRFVAGLAALIFFSAWTFHYWQAWLFLLVFSGAISAITCYVAKYDPRLLKSRMAAGPAAEKEGSQRLIQTLTTLTFIAVFVISALDHRLHGSRVSTSTAILGDTLVMFGLYLVFLVFKENSFASAVIEVGSDQKTVSTGPYSVVRHPMYTGSLVMFAGMPLALGSLWGLSIIVPFSLLIVWRLLDEERFLAGNLGGYSEYQHRVRYRLIPLVW